MARVMYAERVQQVYAAQYKGDNILELEEIAPGKIVLVDDKPMLKNDIGNIPINLTDWVVDDPMIGFPTVVLDSVFSVRFSGVNQAFMSIGRYKPRSITAVDAVMWNGDNFSAVQAVCPQAVKVGNVLNVLTPNGIIEVYVEEFVLRDQVNGTFSKIKDDLFSVFYEVQTI